ncbi:MAG: hypothetical protein U0326_24395 [Polyangiales bacterium]
MKLDLETFPVRADCPATSQWWKALYYALGERIGVPAGAEPNGGGGYMSRGALDDHATRTLRGGLRVQGTKRASYGEMVQVSYALFDEKGDALAWSMDLDALHPGPSTGIYWRDAQGQKLDLSPALKDALKKLKALTPKALATTAPFTADTQLMGVVIAPDESRCYATDYAGMLHAWELPSGREVFRARVGAARTWLHTMAISPDGALVAAGRRKVTVVDTRTGAVRATVDGPRKAEAQGIAFSPDSKHLAIAAGLNVQGVDNGVTVWDASTGAQTFSMRLDAMGFSVAWEPDGRALIVGTEGPGGLRRVDVNAATVTHREDQSDWALDALMRCDRGWCGALWGGEVLVCDATTLKATGRITPALRLGARVWIAPGPAENLVIVSSVSGGEAAIIDTAKGHCVKALPVTDLEGDIMGVACGRRYAVAATGRRVSVWTL